MAATATKDHSHPLADGCPPAWASGWGQDEYGIFADFEVGGVVQRMRWVPAGKFMMGSPDGEEGRWEDEGPVHEVRLTRGYWLFDTPCTQGLWRAVMGEESGSRFKGDRRPVEHVSWEATESFVDRLNGLKAGLSVRLPTEAEWEYACRAGVSGEPRYGELDEVAWHWGNSGGETHDVAQKVASGWGLYDMLGNVWEWCRDGGRQYTNDAVVDPVGPMEAGGNRVIRGGSWIDVARYVRAAYRSSRSHVSRSFVLGFRCLSSEDGGYRKKREQEASEGEERPTRAQKN